MNDESLEPLIELVNSLVTEKVKAQTEMIAGLQFSLIALYKRLIVAGVIEEKTVMADLDGMAAVLTPENQASASALMIHRLMQAISGRVGPKD